MKKLNITATLLGAALFMALGATSASAAMKCGAGKCGSSMEKPAKKADGSGKCGAKMKAEKKGKCGAGKCGDAKKEKKKAKCGTGKCGGKM
ncbi:HvfA family oxazolone/thioamide-modified RiPP metallophore [Sulfurimonas paralvinellae]|uniref:Low-complexity protein n=1 Tax=Sulfurimonas paralvinellae TaxID=317658 RepID=A0A7M1BA31_9BACT|nr:hypothetical protein [Sulfurimonas paralvinellae]QOP46587.1 hypothetical protein FM071_09905 [Sulfurimonas paralvinellae]